MENQLGKHTIFIKKQKRMLSEKSKTTCVCIVVEDEQKR